MVTEEVEEGEKTEERERKAPEGVGSAAVAEVVAVGSTDSDTVSVGEVVTEGSEEATSKEGEEEDDAELEMLLQEVDDALCCDEELTDADFAMEDEALRESVFVAVTVGDVVLEGLGVPDWVRFPLEPLSVFDADTQPLSLPLMTIVPLPLATALPEGLLLKLGEEDATPLVDALGEADKDPVLDGEPEAR